MEADSTDPVEHVCGSDKVVRLGDKIEAVLTQHGITKDAWREWKKEHGLPPTCNCDGRQAWLNKFDETFKIAEAVTGLKKLLRW